MKDGKGFIKEYYDNNYNRLQFEGEYLNGEWKEYNLYGELKFECENLNGERNGKGKAYYNNRDLRFEGEYLNGERKKTKK